MVTRADGMGAVQWPIGRIEAVHPGEDGHVRVVSVRDISWLIHTSHREVVSPNVCGLNSEL